MPQPYKLRLRHGVPNVLHKNPTPHPFEDDAESVFLDFAAAKEVILNKTARACGQCFPTGAV